MNRSGEYVNNLSGKVKYKSFRPSFLPLNKPIVIDKDIQSKLIKANKELSSLNAISSYIPNVDLFVSMYIRKEALLSSQIEGTQCTLEDVLDPSDLKNTNLDVSDVINYIDACLYGIKRLNSLPLCSRFFKELHQRLMKGVRGQEKTPGEFRRSQNWIGGKNSTIAEARYIPPNVDDMKECMKNLEEYINGDYEIDPLIKIAIVHYQFETVHPFLDGNGRVGRLLITLMLMSEGILDKPSLYVSYFLKKNQVEYYDRMSEVRKSGNFEQWVSFFLDAINEAAIDASDTIKKLNELHIQNVDKLPKTNRKKDVNRLLFDYIEKYPIIDIKKTSVDLGLSYNTVASIIDKFVEFKILKPNTNNKRNRAYIYDKYIKIIKKDI